MEVLVIRIVAVAVQKKRSKKTARLRHLRLEIPREVSVLLDQYVLMLQGEFPRKLSRKQVATAILTHFLQQRRASLRFFVEELPALRVEELLSKLSAHAPNAHATILAHLLRTVTDPAEGTAPGSAVGTVAPAGPDSTGAAHLLGAAQTPRTADRPTEATSLPAVAG